MTSIVRWAIFSISLRLIILVTNEEKLVQSKQDCGPIIPMYISVSLPFILVLSFLLLFLFLIVNKDHEKYSNEGPHGIAVAKGSVSMANNIFVDPSIYMMKFIIISKIILHNINFVKIIRAQKPKLIPKIKCTILLEQLYCMYYNT
jgi:hypothetical protein